MARDLRLLFHAKSLLIRAIHGNDAPAIVCKAPEPCALREAEGRRGAVARASAGGGGGGSGGGGSSRGLRRRIEQPARAAVNQLAAHDALSTSVSLVVEKSPLRLLILDGVVSYRMRKALFTSQRRQKW